VGRQTCGREAGAAGMGMVDRIVAPNGHETHESGGGEKAAG
jgi:hypothetical protein